MKPIVFLYDNALIYYPNVFFAVLFFISILGIVLVGIGIIVLGKEIRRVIEEIKSILKQIKSIKIKERKRMSFLLMVRIFFEKKKISAVCIIRFLIISFAYIIRVAFIRINKTLGYIESQAEKIAKKIGGEIFIKE